MHDDLPSDPGDLRILEGYLLRQVARIREQQDASGPVHPDLPADPGTLQVIEAHTAEQLRRASEQLYWVETGDRPWVSGPDPGWRLQALPTAVHHPSRFVMHRADCWIDSGETLTAAEAAACAGRPHVERCSLCRPSPPPSRLPRRRIRPGGWAAVHNATEFA